MTGHTASQPVYCKHCTHAFHTDNFILRWHFATVAAAAAAGSLEANRLLVSANSRVIAHSASPPPGFRLLSASLELIGGNSATWRWACRMGCRWAPASRHQGRSARTAQCCLASR